MDDEDDDFKKPVERMSKDIRDAAATLTTQEARYLVDSYYAMQESRIREAHRLRIMSGDQEEPHSVIAWLSEQNGTIERQVRGALGRFAAAHPVGEWSLGILGIGPVIAAGLLANLDPLWPTVGHIFSFSGLDPTKKWLPGEKRPWSHAAKQLAFKIGDSMVKQSGKEDCLYGRIYRARKEREQALNDKGAFAETAERTLRERKFRDKETIKIYESGKLPPGRIDLRARRIAVKLFLSHWHCVAHFYATGKLPPAPYAIAHAGHAHYIPPPNFDEATFPVAKKRQKPHSVLINPGILEHANRKLKRVVDIAKIERIMRQFD